MAKFCDVMEASIVRVPIDGKNLNAEASYSSTTVTIKNEGKNRWKGHDDVDVWFGFGSGWNKIKKGYFWRSRLPGDVKPKASVNIRFPRFETPPGNKKWDLFCVVTCGGNMTRAATKAEWHGDVTTVAKYSVGLLRSSDTSLEPFEPATLQLGFQNTCDFTFPGGEDWGLKCEVQRAPSGTRREEIALFEFEEDADRWDDDEVEEGERFVVKHKIDSVPSAIGDWQLELTLTRGGKPFEPCARTPAIFKFKIEDFEAEKVTQADILSVSIDGDTLISEAGYDIAIKVKNVGPNIWRLNDNFVVVFGLGTRFESLTGRTSAPLKYILDPGDTTEVKIRDYPAPLSDGRGRWAYSAYVICGGINGEIVASSSGNFNTSASRAVDFLPPKQSRLKPGDEEELVFGFRNAGSNRWARGPEFILRTEVVRPSDAPEEHRQLFELEEEVHGGDTFVNTGDVLSTTRELTVPETDGDWVIKATLLRGGQPYGDTGDNPGTYSFKISKALMSANVQLRGAPTKMVFGNEDDFPLWIDNTGEGTLEKGEWRILLLMIDKPAEADGVVRGIELTELAGPKDIPFDTQTTIKVPVEFPAAHKDDHRAWGQYSLVASLYIKGKNQPLAQTGVHKVQVDAG